MEKNNKKHLKMLLAEMEYFSPTYVIVDNIIVTIDDVRRMIADIAENETAIMYEQMEMDLKGIHYRG